MTRASVSRIRARPLLGTFVEIAAAGEAVAEVEQAIEAAFAAIETVQRLMSFHEPASDVSRLNRAACERPVAVHPWTFAVVTAACAVHDSSGGAFDIAIAPVLQDLGLLPAPDQGARAAFGRPATTGSIALLADGRIGFRDPGLRIDLGGIAKGFAVDRALDVLRARGIVAALVNAGGDLACFGVATRAIEIRHPVTPGATLCTVGLLDAALASSASRHGSTMSADMSPAAIIEPATGREARDVIAASVRASTCMIADALTKVVMIQGTGAAAVLTRYGADALMMMADGAMLATTDWDRMQLHAA